MILDATYNKKKREVQISYINEQGGKSYYIDNVMRFLTYVEDDESEEKDVFGRGVGVRYTENPNKFDLKNYIKNLKPEVQEVLNGRTLPKLFTFDIETDFDDNEFPEAEYAKYPVLSISIASPDLNVIIYGLGEMSEDRRNWLQEQFNAYLDTVPFYKELNIEIQPKITYIKFNSEEDMIRSFFKDIVAKVPIIAGWNSYKFDWQYLQNRVKNNYPNIPMYITSPMGATQSKMTYDKYKNKLRLTLPTHTLVLDLQEIIEGDKTVLPIKESMSLNWISNASLGVKKIEYEGNLRQLYRTDFAKYIFYNAIDSILCQLIDKKFRCLTNYYLLARYCQMPIAQSFSPIAMTEALFFKDFFEHGYKVISGETNDVTRGDLYGAYVKVPTPGKYEYCVCNDFASLYPSTIITCNISIENYICKLTTPEEVEFYKKNPDYFVTVNNSLYKNDKEYSFKRIQRQLKEERAINKYLSKKLYANVISDIDHIFKGVTDHLHDYDEQMSNALATIKMENVEGIKCGSDLSRFNQTELKKFRTLLMEEITFYTSNEQAIKLLMNSMYGGCSHQAFYWFNMALANDITGEARNLTLLMEQHLSNLWTNYWYLSKNIHDALGIKLKPEYIAAMKARDKKLKESGGHKMTKEEEFEKAHENFHRSILEAIAERNSKKKKDEE